ncbi:thioredoxin family protein [Sandaracinobacter sp. RS1-74]|uniref:protein-disulfide reductase DsbD family protein n=1 Tax=Sandaracinobacteroides sayramensis TaxID=2913411 RepID=UPI001EDAE3A5|nr:protein-disulfide reductase DsbD domain-containing protein [Sandaracinobacteroides sayramensis]MCG2841001.1 thioredoxin family protein [Sandaracinobacteroides sayramensis]
MLARFLLLIAALFAAPAFAQSSTQLENTHVELVSEAKAPAPGQRFTIGVVMTPKKGWHTYWEHPGDSGMPTRADWKLPEGASASAFRYPVPETYVVAGLMNHVYSQENVLLAEVDVPQGASGAFPLKVRLDWLVCDDSICIPEGTDLTLPLTIGDGAADPAQKARFEAARAALPRQLSEQALFQTDGKRIRISVPFAGPESVTKAHFFALSDDAVGFASPQSLSVAENALVIETDAVAGATPEKVPGLLRVERGGEVLGLTLTAVPGEVAAGRAAGGASAMAGFLPAFGLAVLGGLLLNLMPCVFPILSLKALSLAKSGHSEGAARTEGLAYAGGVILVTTLLGLAAILIARAGAGAGWAFQLQDPRVILFLMLLTFAIGLNFAGLFEVNLGSANAGASLASKPGAKGAFFTGALAAFVATPCTGPFMAGALGAALVLPPVAGLAVFAGLGLGLALPFLAVGFVPALRRRLPKPGAWMLTFRRILAVPMLLTALGLAWVLGRQAGLEGLIAGLGAALAFAIALWVFGIRQQDGRNNAVPLALAAVVALGAPLALGSLPAEAATGAAAHGPAALDARPFSREALGAAQAARTPTFLYFTADWCLTCKVNEKGALSDPAVAEAFRNGGIQVMVGDWTRPDPAIARFLEERGRAGIPLYLFYGADGQVKELPQLLTVDTLTALASPGSPRS